MLLLSGDPFAEMEGYLLHRRIEVRSTPNELLFKHRRAAQCGYFALGKHEINFDAVNLTLDRRIQLPGDLDQPLHVIVNRRP